MINSSETSRRLVSHATLAGSQPGRIARREYLRRALKGSVALTCLGLNSGSVLGRQTQPGSIECTIQKSTDLIRDWKRVPGGPVRGTLVDTKRWP